MSLGVLSVVDFIEHSYNFIERKILPDALEFDIYLDNVDYLFR